jgi:hemoglobin
MRRLAFACALVACSGGGGGGTTTGSILGGSPTPTPVVTPTSKKLFDRLGGMPAVTAVSGELVDRMIADARLKQRFFNTDAPELKKLLADFVCVATGGPCKYTGRDMATAHAGMDIVDDEFNALVENLAATLDKLKVPQQEMDELLAALGPLKADIVVSPERLKPASEGDLGRAIDVASKLTDKNAQEIMQAAIVAAKRGQRSYAEQLFSRVELIVGAKAVAPAAPAFRAGAPPRVNAPPKAVKDGPPQPKASGKSDDDEPAKKPEKGSFKGTLTLGNAPLAAYGAVMLFPARRSKPRTPKARVVEQRAKTFAPQVTAVPVGSTVSFPNFDSVYHNVFSTSKMAPFDLGLYKTGEAREVKFTKPGIVRVGCNIHANMAAYIVVVDAPHYAVVEGDGEFAFRSLAPGKYKLRAWSEKSAEPSESEITIKPGENTAAIDLKGGAPAGPFDDKFGGSRQTSK